MKQFYTFLAAVLLTATSVAQVGINIETADPSAALDITSTTGGLLPPRMTTSNRDAISAAKGLVLFNTTTNTLQINEGDATTANWVNLSSAISSAICSLSIGDTHQGGIIFYLDATGCHGLIAAPSDQSTGIQWYNGSFIDTYAYANGVGSGDGNGSAIIRWQGTCDSCYASELCQDLNLGGEFDWYLPSKYELNLMYDNIGKGNVLGLGNVGNFSNSPYWSSTEFDYDYAWGQYFINGGQFYYGKGITLNVRAVRAF